jgi:probable HAF family extracellular repeat protein
MKDSRPFRISRLLGIVAIVACAAGCRSDTGLNAPRVASVDVVAYSKAHEANEDYPVFAIVKAPDGTTVSDVETMWTTSDPGIVTVRATGPQTAMVKGMALGTATISASANGQTGVVQITITPLVVPRPPAHAFLWTPEAGMSDLGLLPGAAESMAMALNDVGQVVGSSGTDANERPFLWTSSNGIVELTGFPPGEFGIATGINNSLEVVGYRWTGTSGGTHAFLWTSSGGVIDLGALPGATTTYARSINNNGVVVGYSGGRPFRWTALRGMEELTIPSTGTGGDATGINDQGQIVGLGNSGNDANQRAVLWGTDGKPIEVTCCFAVAASVNQAGDIAGMFGPGRHAFFWSPASGRTEIGYLPGMSASSAADINDQDQITGTTRAGALDRAFLWSRGSGMSDLGGLPGRESSFGFAINNKGQVVGFAD